MLGKPFFRRNTDVFQGKMVQRSAKRPAVRVRWQFSDALYKQNAPISGSEISGKAPAGQTCPCRAQPGNRSPLHIHSQQKRCGNTGLLTCVGERASLLRPHPAFSQVFPAMADFRPGGLMTASVWPHAHSTVSCRHNACFLGCICICQRAQAAGLFALSRAIFP